MDKFVQIFKQVAEDSRYEERVLIEEFKRERERERERGERRESISQTCRGRREWNKRHTAELLILLDFIVAGVGARLMHVHAETVRSCEINRNTSSRSRIRCYFPVAHRSLASSFQPGSEMLHTHLTCRRCNGAIFPPQFAFHSTVRRSK